MGRVMADGWLALIWAASGFSAVAYREVAMSAGMRRIVGILFVVACVAAAAFFVARGANPGAGIGAAIGVVVVLIMSNRARKGRAR